MDQKLSEQVRELAIQAIERNSRVDALTAMVGALLTKMGFPPNLLDNHIDQLAALVRQKRLERLEQRDPLGASLLDDRSLQDVEDLDLQVLDSIRFLDENS